jgi:hypothetical protein
MAFKWTDGGLNFVEEVLSDTSSTTVLDTIAVGDGTNAPSESDTSLGSELFSIDDSSNNVTVERGSGIGEIRATIEFTGGTEVPANSSIREIGFVTSEDTLVYREVRSAEITVDTGETKVIEIQAFVEDIVDNTDQIITTVGRNYVADRMVGDTTDAINTIAIGDSTGTVSESDTTLTSEIYRGVVADSNIQIESTTNAGELNVEITLSAGSDFDDEVAAGAEISEFGLLTESNVLVFHEKREILTLENNDTKTFNIPFSITQ